MPGTNSSKHYKCSDCWRVYDEWQLLNGPYDSCKCGSRRFRNSPNLKLRRFLTDYKYIIFGEKAYDEKR